MSRLSAKSNLAPGSCPRKESLNPFLPFRLPWQAPALHPCPGEYGHHFGNCRNSTGFLGCTGRKAPECPRLPKLPNAFRKSTTGNMNNRSHSRPRNRLRFTPPPLARGGQGGQTRLDDIRPDYTHRRSFESARLSLLGEGSGPPRPSCQGGGENPRLAHFQYLRCSKADAVRIEVM